MEFRILGPMEVVAAGAAVALGGAQQRAVLGLLLISSPEPLSPDRLIDELWAERPPASAGHAVQVYVSGIRKLLRTGERDGLSIRSSPSGYRLEVDPEQVDARRFERLVNAAQRTLARDAAVARRGFEEALQLWRGTPLAECARSELARREADRLAELRSLAVEGIIDARLGCGEHAEVIGELTRVVAADPLRERPRQLLMLALYRSGRQAEALAAYRDARAALDEIGLQPGPELRRLEGAILRHDLSLAPPRPVVERAPGQPAPDPSWGSAAPVARRKVVNVLVCDLSVHEPDPEALRGVLDGCVGEVRTAVERHGGTVNSSAGSVVMAAFGIPHVREDDALRAVRAAVDLQQRLLRAGVGFSIAIDTGIVVVGEPDVPPVGDPVNVAVRLGQAAPRGEILLGEETARLVRDAVHVEPLDAIALDGRATPLRALRLVALDPLAPGVRRRFDRPLVGRERELALLRRAWDRTVEESGCHLFTLLGVAGVGKSRLVAELLTLSEGAATVLSGRCLHYGEGVTFWPLLEALSPVGGIAAPVVEKLRSGGVATPEELFLAVRRLLESLSARQPVVLHVDDLQWAEPMLLDLLDHVVELSRGAPILVLCVARPELLEDRPAWGGGKLNSTALLLEPLAAAECEALLDQLGDGLAPDVRGRVIAGSQGNPLFLEEMATLARERGLATVPASIHALLAARLDRLPDEERELLERAAIEGESFHRAGVAALVQTNSPQLDELLARLVRKELIWPQQPASGHDEAFRFRHLLIRDAAYDGLAKASRADLHERFAAWLEQGPGELAQLDEIAGWHLEQAVRYRRELGGRTDAELARRAAEHLHAAGRHARDRSDVATAISLLERAHALAAPDAFRLAIGVDLAEQLIEAGHPGRAEALLWPAENDPATAAPAMLTRFEWSIRAQPEELLRSVMDAIPSLLQRLAHTGDDRGVARAHMLAYWVQMEQARAAAGAEQTLLAAEHAGMAGDDGLRSRALGLHLATLVNLGLDAETLARRVDAVEAADSGPWLGAFVALVRGEIERLHGRADSTRQLMQSAVDQFKAMGIPLYAAGSRHFQAWAELSFGEPALALPALMDGDASMAALGERGVRSTMQAILADVHELLGNSEEARAAVELSDELGAADDLINVVITHAVRARLALADGDGAAAERWARSAVEHAFKTDYAVLRGNAQLDLARVLSALGGRDEATPYARAALELFEVKGDRPRTKLARAVMAELTGSSSTM